MSVHGPSVRPFTAPAPAAPARSQPFHPPSAASEPANAAAAAHSLWDLLTEDERAFFTRQASLGALQYGRSRREAAGPASDAPIGGRIDVRG